MKFVPNALSSKAARMILKSQKNSPTLLFAAGVVGFGTTIALACRATLQVEDILDEHEKSMVELDIEVDSGAESEVINKDKTRVYARTTLELVKVYSPAIMTGALTVAAFTGSHRILNKRNAGLIAAYSTVEKTLAEYRERVRNEIGEDKEREVYYGLEACETVDEVTGKKVKSKRVGPNSASMYARFFTPENRNYNPVPELNFLWLKAKQQYANDLLHARGHVFLNDIYDELGLDRTPAGSQVGWIKDSAEGDGRISFGIFDDELTERVLDFMTGAEKEILLDFNVDGVMWNLI